MNDVLAWLPSPRASALYAAAALARGRHFADRRLEAAMAEPVANLVSQFARAQVPSAVWQHLVPLAETWENNRELVQVSLQNVVGQGARAELASAELVQAVALIFEAVNGLYPRLARELTLRALPIREQWEARGPGLMRQVHLAAGNLTPKCGGNINILLVHPALGGGGTSHAIHNAVVMEAVLANAWPELPEVARLAWLLAQLSAARAASNLEMSAPRQIAVRAWALIPCVLAAAEYVELALLNESTISLALATWEAPAAEHSQLASQLWHWWKERESIHLNWPTALANLEQRVKHL